MKKEWMRYNIKIDDAVSLSVNTVGEGKPLLLIHGAVVDSEFFLDFADLMADHFHVITYDRRGYGNSTSSDSEGMTGQQYYSLQADDAFRVLTEFAGEPAIVLGCSAGAITAMFLAVKYPQTVRKLFLHEPPLYDLIKDNQEVWDNIARIKESILAGRYNHALNSFILFVTASRTSKKEMTEHEIEYFMHNGLNYIKNEYLMTFGGNLIPEKIPEETDALILLGRESLNSHMAVTANRLSGYFGIELVEMPGGHNAARDDSPEFAQKLLSLI